ncbi:MAG TPA: hypothetical protein VFI81_10485, partial [Rhodanobacteraceae bacterium]|nr:hypothetical protein [Rhodanobacteraceae bacterium]
GAVWALSQGISQLSGPLGLANWVTVWFLIACAIGFPLWIAFAWFYKLTPQGFMPDSQVALGPSIAHSTARKMDFAIIGVLALAVALLASGYFVRRHAPVAVVTSGSAPAKPVLFNPPAGTLLCALGYTAAPGDRPDVRTSARKSRSS